LNRKSNSGPGVYVVPAIIAAVVAVGIGAFMNARQQPEGTPNPAGSPAPAGQPQAILPESPPVAPIVAVGAERVTVYKVVTDANGSHLGKVALSLPGASVGDSATSALAALNAMADEKDSPLPTGSRANTCVLNGDLATVDFNQALVKNFAGGDEAEALAINSILATVGQFGARQVQITVEGKKIDSLGGTQSLTSPLPVPQTGDQTAQSGVKP
jgi:hypothetical protein